MTSNRLLKALVLCPVLLLFAIVAHAQKPITGKITDEKGNPIVGASITTQGGKTGTTTDAAGNFSLNAPAGTSAVTVSYVGYTSQDVDVSSSSNVSLSLAPSASALTDVVVVGYGTTKKSDLTGSVASVTPKDYNKGVIATPEQLIQGRTPGVQITQTSGEPGAASIINIRGSASIRGDQQPLYVIDGVPVGAGGTMATSSGVEGSSSARNPLLFLNPNDIASMTILKDASSAAIYGSRGANGVILITTKSGRGTGAFQLSINQGFSEAANTYDLLSAPDFINSVVAANVLAGVPENEARENVKSLNKGANTDWQDKVLRTGIAQGYNLSYGFSKKNTILRLSVAYDDQQGIVQNSGLKRLATRGNISQKLFNDKFRIDANLSYTNARNQYPPLTNNAGYQGSLIGAAISFNPTYPVFNPDGTYFDPLDGSRNPAQMVAYFDDRDVIDRYMGNLTLTYNITSDLSFKQVLGIDKSNSIRSSFADPRLGTAAFGGTNTVFGVNLNNPIQGNGRGTRQGQEITSLLTESYLTYDKAFGENTINAVLGYSYQDFESNYRNRYYWGLTTPVVKATDVFHKEFDEFTNNYWDAPYYSKSQLQSFFARINYSYGNKYFLTGTVRADGSSKFGENHRYGVFPALAFKWKLLNENFAKGLGGFFNDLSIRANYGILGSQDGIGPYDALNKQTTYIGTPNGDSVTNFNYYGNPDLQWEQATTTGVGIDYAFWNNRISGTVDYYYTKRKNVLFYAPTPGGFAPTSNWFINLPGYVINSGIEFSINAIAVSSAKFKWEINYNMTFFNNDVKDFNQIVNTGGVNGQGLTGAYAQTIQDGYPLFTWKMPVFDGFDKDGYAMYANGGQDQLLGSALPTFNAGLTNTFTFDRFSASIFFNAVSGLYIYNNTANALLLKGSIKNGRNVTYDAANSPENPINPGSVSSRFLEEGDFIRLSNVTLNYALKLSPSSVFKSFSIFASGQNLALFTDYSGLDPEVNVDHNINGVPSRGFDYTAYPRPRTVSIGATIGF